MNMPCAGREAHKKPSFNTNLLKLDKKQEKQPGSFVSETGFDTL